MINFNPPPKLASTASGMSFEEWKNRPVYVAQCKTAAIANELCGVKLAHGQGLASILGDDAAGLHTFRALSAYRTPEANKLRQDVAKVVLAQRKAERAPMHVMNKDFLRERNI